MSGKPVILRERARRDIDEAVGHYLIEAAKTVALDFIDSMEGTCRLIGDHPVGGSPRHACEPGISGLCIRPAGKFPYLVVRVQRETDIDVWRVLHGARDIPTRFRELT